MLYECVFEPFSSAEAHKSASLSWNVGRGKPLKENRGERWFHVDWDAKDVCIKFGGFTSEVVSLAHLWMASRTYQDYLAKF